MEETGKERKIELHTMEGSKPTNSTHPAFKQ